MKIKLADGTEVDVPDTDPVAVAAQQLEKVKALGFESIEAYQNSRESEVERLKKQTASDQEFINRQKNELGELRKATGKPKPKEDEEEEEPVNEKTETPEQREQRFAKANDTLQDALSDQEREHAEAEFKKAYEAATPQERALMKTEEGRHTFMGLVFPEKATEEQTPVSLFRKREPTPLSIGERVKAALTEADKGRSRRPVIPNHDGSGYRPSSQRQEPKTPPVPVARSGGVLDAVKAIETAN